MIKYLILVIFFLPILLIVTPLIIIMYLKPSLFPLTFRYRFLRYLLKYLGFVNRLDLRIEGEENLPKEGPTVLIPNHQSFYDALLLITSLKRNSTFVAKIETKKMPYIGMFVKIIDGLFLDRQDIRKQVKTIKEVEDLLNRDKSPQVIIFPEGTRTRDENFKMLEFKGGSFKPCYKTMATIVPVAIFGTHRFLSKKWYFRHRIDIHFLKPLRYKDYKDIPSTDLAVSVREMIANELEEIYKVNDKKI